TRCGRPPRTEASASYPGVPVSARRSTWVRNGSSRTATASLEACCSSWVRAASGERRSSCTLAIATCSLWIVENSCPNLHGHNVVADQGLKGFAFAVEPIFDQGEPEGAPQIR